MFPHLGTHLYVNKVRSTPTPWSSLASPRDFAAHFWVVFRFACHCHMPRPLWYSLWKYSFFLLMALCVEATYIEKLFAPGGRCGPLYTPIHIYMDVESDGIRSSNRLKSDSLSQFAYIHFECPASFFLVGILIVAPGFDATPTYCNETFQGCQASRPRHRQARRCIV